MTLKVHCPDGFTQHDISVEQTRTYIYPDQTTLKIDNPQVLFLKQDERGDSHRIVTKDGVTWYPRRGWNGINWRNFPEADPVQF